MSQQTVVLITLITYKLALVGIGLWAARRVRDEDDFFLGGRNVGAWVSGLSYAASTSSAWVLLGFSGFVYVNGVSALWMMPGIWMGYVVMWTWVGRAVRTQSAEHGHVTLTDYLTGGLGRADPMARKISLAATLMIILCFIFYIAAQFDAAAKAFVDQFDLSMLEAVLIGAVIILLYSLLGGFWAVSVTDTLQGAVMLLVAIGLPLAAVMAAGGVDKVFATLEWTMPPAYLNMTGAMGPAIFIGFLLGVWGIGASALGQPHLISRLMAIRDDKARQQGYAIAMVWAVLVYVGMAALALAGRALVSGGAIAGPSGGEAIFYRVASEVLSPVLAGIVIAATLSAVMSTVDSILLAASAAVAHDLGLNARHPARAVMISRVTMSAIAIFAVILTLTLPDTIFNRVLFAWAALGAAFGPIVIARVARWTPSGRRILLSILLGFFVTVGFYTLGTMPVTGAGGITDFLVGLAKLPGDPFERVAPWILPLAILYTGRNQPN